MSNIIYGVLDMNDCHVDFSHSLKATKRHATINGYAQVSKRHVMSGSVCVESTKTDGKWINERDNSVNKSVICTLLKSRFNDDKRFSLKRIHAGFDVPYWCGCFCNERVTEYYFSINQACDELALFNKNRI